jgi:hypothetical protein
MATKKVLARKNNKSGAKKTSAKKRVRVSAKSPRRETVAVTAPLLLRAARQAEVAWRRAGQLYVEKATEFEVARIAQLEAERELAVFYAQEAKREQRPFQNFLAQGDSWFSYACGFALIGWLQARFGSQNAYFDNIAVSGRTLRQMLSRQFKDKLAAGPPNGQPWTAILISGGGNDICGDYRFRDWLKPYDGTDHPPDWYVTSAFDREAEILQGIYEEMIHLVGRTSRVFAHDYDFAIPDGRCVTGRSPRLERSLHLCFAGPWMWPAFEERGFHKPGEPISQLSKDIVTTILKRFADMLAGLEQRYPNQFALVRTQGTLKPIQDVNLWDNELHPYDSSFRVLAQPFYEKLRAFL